MDQELIHAIEIAAMQLTKLQRKNGFSLEPKHGGAIHYYTTPDGAITHARIRLKNPDTGEKWIRPISCNASGDRCELKAPQFDGGAPLYNLHQLCDPARQSERVLLVEGENKVDTLIVRNILATTSGGAQSLDTTDLTPLAGREILIWADNDEPGFEYAQKAAAKLRAIGCKVDLVNVPALNLPHKGDVVDWASAFRNLHKRRATAEDIWALPITRRVLIKTNPVPKDEMPATGSSTVISSLLTNSPRSSQPTKSDDETVQWLASLNLLEYDRVRKEHATALGVRPSILDDMVKTARLDENEAGRLPFVEVEPHTQPIDPAELLTDVSNAIRQFIVLDIEQANAAALWIALTWFIDEVEVAPLAIVNAPEKSCGKTLFLTVLGRMSYRALPASNASASALFRAVELWKPTILIDEADTFFRDNMELNGMVNAGYLRGGFVLRSEAVGDSFEPHMFSVFSAKAIAGIALERHLSDATMSRGIVFNLRRKLPHESVSRLRHADRDIFERITERLARFAADYAHQVRAARPELPGALSDRDQDNWEGLFSVASCAGEDWLHLATTAALSLSGAGEKKVSTGNELLADIQHAIDGLAISKISTAKLIDTLCADDESAWATYNHGKPITPRQVARQLAAYGICSKTVRLGRYETAKGYEVEQFNDVFARYLPSASNSDSLSVTPSQATTRSLLDVTTRTITSFTQNEKVTLENPTISDCDGVTDNPEEKPLIRKKLNRNHY